MLNEEQVFDRTGRIECLEIQREETQDEINKVNALIGNLEEQKDKMPIRSIAREQITIFLNKLKNESESLRQIEQEISDSIYYVQGY